MRCRFRLQYTKIEVSSGVIQPALASICRSAAQPIIKANAAYGLVGLMLGAIKLMKQAKSIFNEAENPMEREALCSEYACSRFVLMFSILATFLCVQLNLLRTDAVGLNLNFDMQVHINMEVSSGVIQPALASICRSAAQPIIKANAAISLRA
jgi:hypothetical protein